MEQRFKVEGMSCGKCVGRVTRAFQSLEASAQVEVKLAESSARVTWRASAPDLDEVVAALDEAGYAIQLLA